MSKKKSDTPKSTPAYTADELMKFVFQDYSPEEKEEILKRIKTIVQNALKKETNPSHSIDEMIELVLKDYPPEEKEDFIEKIKAIVQRSLDKYVRNREINKFRSLFWED